MTAYKYKHNLKGAEIAEKVLSVMETVVMFITMANTRYKCEMHYILLVEPLHFPHCVTRNMVGPKSVHQTIFEYLLDWQNVRSRYRNSQICKQ